MPPSPFLSPLAFKGSPFSCLYTYLFLCTFPSLSILPLRAKPSPLRMLPLPGQLSLTFFITLHAFHSPSLEPRTVLYLLMFPFSSVAVLPLHAAPSLLLVFLHFLFMCTLLLTCYPVSSSCSSPSLVLLQYLIMCTLSFGFYPASVCVPLSLTCSPNSWDVL
jgi:hypothetical protein